MLRLGVVCLAIFFASQVGAQSPPSRRSVILFEALRANQVDERTAHTWLVPVVREAQACLGADAPSAELGRLHVGTISNDFTVALSPIGRAAIPGSVEQALFACVHQTFARIARQTAPSAGDVTLRVHIRTPSVAAGLLKLPARTGGVVAHPLLTLGRMAANAAAGPASREGILARETLEAQIASHEAEVRDCFRAHLRTDRQSPASFELEFEIHENGHVLSAQVLDDAHVSPVTACVIDRLRGWELGPPRGGAVRVRHSFTADLRSDH